MLPGKVDVNYLHCFNGPLAISFGFMALISATSFQIDLKVTPITSIFRERSIDALATSTITFSNCHYMSLVIRTREARF